MTASSDTDMANMALGYLAEDPISSLATSTIPGVSENTYETLIRSLIERHAWRQFSALAVLEKDGTATPVAQFKYAYRLPDVEVSSRLGYPDTVYRGSSELAPKTTDYRLVGEYIFTNEEEIAVAFRQRTPVTSWQESFKLLAAAALAAQWAMPVTETRSLRDDWNLTAFGLPSEGGRGGLFKQAVDVDSLFSPSQSLLDVYDPVGSARFGGSQSSANFTVS